MDPQGSLKSVPHGIQAEDRKEKPKTSKKGEQIMITKYIDFQQKIQIFYLNLGN